MSIKALFTVLLKGPCGYWYQHIHHFYTESHHQGAVNTVETLVCMLPGVPVSGWLSCCTIKVYSDIQRRSTAFFLPPCVFCVTINLISSDLAREHFPCNLATTRRCLALASACQELDFLSLVPGANNRTQHNHQHQRLNSKKVYF